MTPPTKPTRIESRLAVAFREAKRDARLGANATAIVHRLQMEVAAALTHAAEKKTPIAFDSARFNRSCKEDFL